MRPPPTCLPPAGRSGRGFTLVELMICLVVVTLLAGVALPSYQNTVRKGRRADAADAAVGLLQAQERYRANNTSYAGTLTAVNQGASSSGGYYSLALSAASGAGYTLALTAVSGKSQANDSGCTNLGVVVVNGSPSYTPAACWSR